MCSNPKKGEEYILTAIEQMCNKYKQRGIFKVTQIEGDGAFECVRTELQSNRFGNICLITCDVQKHILRIERKIRTLKNRIRSTWMLMKFDKILKQFAREMVKEVTKIEIHFPGKEEYMLFSHQ